MLLARAWYLAVLAGLVGALIAFDAAPGINWLIWIAIVVTGLVAYRRPDRPTMCALAIPLGFSLVLSAGAAVTATPLLGAAICIIVASLLALAVRLSSDPGDATDYGAFEILTAPLFGFAHTLRGLATALLTTVESAEGTRRHPALRGAMIATPIVVVFALLFASADPLLARGRDFVVDTLTSWDSLPRLIFGVLLSLFVLGAYTASLRSEARTLARVSARSTGIGAVEWRIVIGSVAVVSWLFILLQISYLFFTVPSAAGSGVTFAEYARRGFGELALVATAAALLVTAANSHTRSSERVSADRGLVASELVLLAAVVCILMSAFHRVSLYEAAYGFTSVRVYAQAYIVLVFTVLVALAWHVSRTFDVRALARQVMVLCLLTLSALIFWNADAWVAKANIDRFARTGKLDVQYLTRGLSPDAYPTLVSALGRMPEATRTELAGALTAAFAKHPYLHEAGSWYEWNLRRARARTALIALASSRGHAPF